MTDAYVFRVGKSIPKNLVAVKMLVTTIRDINRIYNNFNEKKDIGNFAYSMARRNNFTSEDLYKSFNDESCLFLHCRWLMLNASRIRLAFLDGQKRHYVMAMTMINSKIPIDTNQKLISPTPLVSEKKNLQHFGFMMTSKAYCMVSSRLDCTSENDHIGKKILPLYQQKSKHLMVSNSQHAAATTTMFMTRVLEKIAGTFCPEEKSQSGSNSRPIYVPREMWGRKTRSTSTKVKNDVYDDPFSHMHHLREFILNEILNDEEYSYIHRLKPTFKEFDAEAFLSEQEKKGLTTVESTKQCFGLFAFVLILSQFYYDDQSFGIFKTFVQKNGIANTELHEHYQKLIDPELFKRRSVRNCYCFALFCLDLFCLMKSYELRISPNSCKVCF